MFTTDDFERAPEPEEQSFLVPPRWRPPTAVGTMTLPPPPPAPRFYFGARSRSPRKIAIVSGVAGVAGTATAVFAPWLPLQVIGVSVGTGGLFLVGLLFWATQLAPRIWLWRDRHWIRRRQAELKRRSLPAV